MAGQQSSEKKKSICVPDAVGVDKQCGQNNVKNECQAWHRQRYLNTHTKKKTISVPGSLVGPPRKRMSTFRRPAFKPSYPAPSLPCRPVAPLPQGGTSVRMGLNTACSLRYSFLVHHHIIIIITTIIWRTPASCRCRGSAGEARGPWNKSFFALVLN